ncbi:GlcG/HbpS family heme-binding protein [Sulfitobacter donghicola]|uniref:DNA polymerase III subunit delta n=1 Tax=Sulfitobacter donghicola DSW-25 = KCTC 12864 = JCM 14565 TaxID=1300350 RepID=A0A073IWR6_9RHOB|nr:heme-binding protein [Sulfitobacter donghicola]KEJ89832.1 DNA polymerase III subunit delta' [Sulfitobacter donghicola DSW-25 = KCTC 12864 = JCM 14565]KIN67048.1 GlcG protein [Sulfitobacter donghicola DSW-25 = KCTC 12864 = JCM 14565]
MLTINRLDSEDAKILIEGARAKALEIGVDMCIAVNDEGGNLIAFERMDGGKITSIGLAIDKGFTASGIQKSTQALGEVNQPGKPAHGISSTLGGRMVAVGGGLPVFAGTDVIGGIGVSSGSPSQDHDVAQAGVDAFSQYQNNKT